MMRTTSATLLAAQRLPWQQPVVELKVTDRRPWARYGEKEADYPFRAALGTNADQDKIMIAALDENAKGKIYTRLVPVTDDLPSSPGDWVGVLSTLTGWVTAVSSGAKGYELGDVAVGCNGTTWYLYYFDSTGRYLHHKTSTDDGDTWSAAAAVHDYTAAVAGAQRVCCSSPGQGQRVWYAPRGTGPTDRVGYRVYSGGWAAEVARNQLTEGSDYGACYGLAAVKRGDNAQHVVFGAFDDDGAGLDPRVGMERHTASGASQAAQRIVPPGNAALGWLGKWPSAARVTVDGSYRYILSWWDSYSSGGMSWGHSRFIYSDDNPMDHWSFESAVRVGTSSGYAERLALGTSGAHTYWYKVNTMGRIQWYDHNDAGRNMEESAQLIRYRMDERFSSGYLEVDLDNRNGTYDSYTRGGGGGGEALQPLAEVTVDQGLATSAGTEQVEGRLFLLWDVSWMRGRNRNWLHLRCEDPWTLFRAWAPGWTFVFTDRTVQWMVEELVFRCAGLQCSFDAADAWETETHTIAFVPAIPDPLSAAQLKVKLAYEAWREEATEGMNWRERQRWEELNRWVKPPGITAQAWKAAGGGPNTPYRDPEPVYVPEPVGLTIGQGMSGYAMVQRVLDLIGAKARWGDGDNVRKLYCWVPDDEGDSPTADLTYTSAELQAGQYTRAFQRPNYARAEGNAVIGVEWQEETAGSTGPQDVQQIFCGARYDLAWGDQTTVDDIADALLDEGQARKWRGWVRTFPHAGLELGDFIAVVDTKAGGGSVINDKYRVIRLVTEYGYVSRLWQQTCYFEGV